MDADKGDDGVSAYKPSWKRSLERCERGEEAERTRRNTRSLEEQAFALNEALLEWAIGVVKKLNKWIQENPEVFEEFETLSYEIDLNEPEGDEEEDVFI
jgi:purine nucleoside permease